MEQLDEEYVLLHASHFNLKFNRRGHLKSATRKQRISLQPLSNNGEGFRQLIDSGPVWALRGTPGSASVRACA